MRLTNEEAITAIDPDFAQMAVAVGRHAWGLPQLSMREKAFVFLGADMCTRALGFPLRTHAQMARAQGVSMGALREAVRHLAPYVGYPTAAEALMALADIETPPVSQAATQPAGRLDPDEPLRESVTALDEKFGVFFCDQFAQRWGRGELSIRERALATVATDVLNGTIDESLRTHVGLALGHGASEEDVRAVVLLVAEFGIVKAWEAYRALRDILTPPTR